MIFFKFPRICLIDARGGIPADNDGSQDPNYFRRHPPPEEEQ